jgi:hypothetical protein
MRRSSGSKEKRRHRRILINVPVDFQNIDKPNVSPGLVINLSQTGFLIQTSEEMPIGKRINIKVSFPKGFEVANFSAVVEIVWKDICLWEDWEGYQYGLKFIKVLNKDLPKLKHFLNNRYDSVEISPAPTA